MSEELLNKHDELSRQFLSNVEVARDFLSQYLPKDILQMCDLSTINIESGSHVEHNLKKSYSDVVYRIDLYREHGQPCRCVYVYTLIEHQSNAQEIMPLRIAFYCLSVLQKHIDKYPDDVLKLPIVVPLVFYHGEKSPYPYPCDIADMFANKDLYRKAPLGSFGLIDLTIKEDNELLKHKKLALLEIALKSSKHRDFTNMVRVLVDALQIAHAENINDALIDGFISYLAYAKEAGELEPLFKKIKKEIPFYEDKIMSYAEELRKEGMQLGRQEGMQLGKQEGMQLGKQEGMQLGRQEGTHEAQLKIAKNLLKSGVDDKIVVQSTELDQIEIDKLKKSMH